MQWPEHLRSRLLTLNLGGWKQTSRALVCPQLVKVGSHHYTERHLYSCTGSQASFPTYTWFNQGSAIAHVPTHRYQEKITEGPRISTDLHDSS